MPKRTMFTNITPLPPQVSREVAIAMLHNHDEMIELNPLVIEHHVIKTPRDAPADEFLDCVWQELTDKVHYLPGGIVKGKVSYRACFHDIPNGLQTHVYAPMGLHIREKWSIGGSLPGETPEIRELGVNTPTVGLYIREDCDMKCNIMLTSFVRKNLDNAHKVLVERLLKKAERVEQHLQTMSPTTSGTNVSTTGSAGFQRGSHMAQSQFVSSPRQETFSSPLASPEHETGPDMSSIHPAFRNDPPGSYHEDGQDTLPAYHTLHETPNGYPKDAKRNPYQQQPRQGSPSQQQQSQSQPQPQPSVVPKKEFIAELPGSDPKLAKQNKSSSSFNRESLSELSTSETLQPRQTSQRDHETGSEDGSMISEPSRMSNGHLSRDLQHDSYRVSLLKNEEYIELPTPPPAKSTF